MNTNNLSEPVDFGSISRTTFPRWYPTAAGREKKERDSSNACRRTRASGKRRRGAYQRHLLIYFAAVGRSAVHGRGSSLGFAPTNLSPLPPLGRVRTRDD